jgi:hypothetical protein
MKRDMNFFAQNMRYQSVHGFVHYTHAVVSCKDCHQLMLAMNLDSHTSGHVSGGVQDPTMTLVVSSNKKEMYAHY